MPTTFALFANSIAMRLPDAEQPISTEIKMADGIFMKTMRAEKAGTLIPQHAHKFSHVSNLVRGKIRVFVDGKTMGDYEAPIGITIAANLKHMFETLVDDTIMLCVHDIGTAEAVEIVEEHQIV